jgi:hypothetical protein
MSFIINKKTKIPLRFFCVEDNGDGDGDGDDNEEEDDSALGVRRPRQYGVSHHSVPYNGDGQR